jgi:SAM-dependent methyltransferase
MPYNTDQSKARVIGQNISYHNGVAEAYDQIMDDDPANKVIRQKVREKLCGLLPSGRVLDFGGGTGLDMEWLVSHGYEVLFCEPSAAMREKAIHYNNTILRSDKITFLDDAVTDFIKWERHPPFSQKVDIVLSNFGPLNYIPDITLLFKNLARVIRPGGHMVLLVLQFDFKKRLKSHRRNAITSLLFRRPFVMYIPHKEYLQTVFVHSEKEIKKASAAYFIYAGNESLAALGFTLIHLIRNETAD